MGVFVFRWCLWVCLCLKWCLWMFVFRWCLRVCLCLCGVCGCVCVWSGVCGCVCV